MYKIGSWIFGVIGFYSFGNGLWQLANMSYFFGGFDVRSPYFISENYRFGFYDNLFINHF